MSRHRLVAVLALLCCIGLTACGGDDTADDSVAESPLPGTSAGDAPATGNAAGAAPAPVDSAGH